MFHGELFDDTVSFSDRANVLVGVGYLELALEEALRSRFVELTPDESLALFSSEADAPLSNLGAKIKLGYALGCYQILFQQDLKVMQLIRNYFAHSVEYADFSDEAVVSALSSLNFPKYCATYYFNRAFTPSFATHKATFVETCKWATLELVFSTRRDGWFIEDRRHYPRFPWPEPSPQTGE